MEDAVTHLRAELARLMFVMEHARAAGNDELASMLANVAARYLVSLADAEHGAARRHASR